MFQEVKSERMTSTSIATMDYKIKCEPIRFREITSEFFNKKGISWNGSAIFHSSTLRIPREFESIDDDFDL